MALREDSEKALHVDFGALLKHYRERAVDAERGSALTQARLAELADCGFNAATLGHWETGRRTIRHQERFTLQRLVTVLHGCGGLQTLEEADQLLESGLYRRLTEDEIRDINPAWLEDREQASQTQWEAASPMAVVLSPAAIYESLDAVFRWSEASEHARSSWAGMFLWSISALARRLTADKWFQFLSFLILWLVCWWLMGPLLSLPLVGPAQRLHAALLFASATLVVPAAVALLSPTDAPVDAHSLSRDEKLTLYILKLTGAVVGFGTLAVTLFLFALGAYYLGFVGERAYLAWRLATLVPLFMAHVGSRRIPADRYQMFGGSLRLHEADLPFLVTFLLSGAALGAFAYFAHDVLVSLATGVSALVVAASMALWQRHKQAPLPDAALVLALGTVAPFLILSVYLFVLPSPQIAASVVGAGAAQVAVILVYLLSLTTMAMTLLVRRGMKWTRVAAGGLLLAALALSLALNLTDAVSLWANVAAYALVAGALIAWAFLRGGGDDGGRRVQQQTHADKPETS